MMGDSGSAGQRLHAAISRFANDQSGVTAIEYGLIAAGISIVIIGAVTQIGSDLNTLYYEKIKEGLE